VLGSVLLIGSQLQFPFEKADLYAYRDAANRLLAGASLYPPSDPDAGNVFRYAPWFAAAWIPFAVLGDAGVAAWRLVVLLSACYVVGSLLWSRTPAAVVLAGLSLPLLASPVLGNVETPLVALLVWRRCDSWSVGIAGSLKLYPLLLCAGYVAERRWRDGAIAIGTAGLLWLPALLLGLTDYVTDPGGANGAMGGFLWDHGLFFPAFALVGLTIAILAARRSRWTWVAASLAIPWSVPRYTGQPMVFLWPALRAMR
jgi:hypothetical protein